MLKKVTAWLRPRKEDLGSIVIPLSRDHRMVKVANAMDWDSAIEIAAARRRAERKYLSGPTPNYRTNLGALLVRALESCPLRKSEDLIQNYAPARYLCGLGDDGKAPNFRTQSDFEIMMGAEGLSAINQIFLHTAAHLGFADIKGLCSDTTAQEAQIPYPNEVGLMGSFARSVSSGIETLGRIGSSLRTSSTATIKAIAALIRKHRLFAKTQEERSEIESLLLAHTESLMGNVISWFIARRVQGTKSLKGQGKTARQRLARLTATMLELTPQMAYFFKTRKVAPGKIVSLFLDGVHSIVRGKAGKKVEFGLKWGINQIRGGYVSIFQMEKHSCDADFAVESIKRHARVFGEVPQEFGFDRAGWSAEHLDAIAQLGVQRVAVAPKGQAEWLVSERCKKRMVNERAQVEGKIGTLKSYGLNKPASKTTAGMVRSAHRAEIRFNVTKLMKDCAKVSMAKQSSAA
jgi:hypothetical protein